MMNEITTTPNNVTIFENPEFGSVRSLTVNGEPYFVGKDVAEILGYGNTRDALAAHVDKEDKAVIQKSEIATLEIPNRGLTVINESGLYSLIISSKLPSAKRFKRWVTHEVLPSIRKTGSYSLKMSDNVSSELKAIAGLVQEMINTQERVAIVDKKADQAIAEASAAKNAVNTAYENLQTVIDAIQHDGNWRSGINKQVNRIANSTNIGWEDLWPMLYNEFGKRTNKQLNVRLKNMKRRMQLNGATITAINKTNKLDVIESEKEFREIFSKIVAEYVIKYCVKKCE